MNNKYENNLIKDLDRALDMHIPATRTPVLAELTKYVYKEKYSEDEIIESANKIYMEQVFFNEYGTRILRLLKLAGEDPIYVSTVPCVLAEGIFRNNLNELNSHHDFPYNALDAVHINIWLYFKHVKDDNLYRFLSDTMKTTRYVAKAERSIYLSLLPTPNTKTLDYLVRGISAHT